jgi:hypothetical protein
VNLLPGNKKTELPYTKVTPPYIRSVADRHCLAIDLALYWFRIFSIYILQFKKHESQNARLIDMVADNTRLGLRLNSDDNCIIFEEGKKILLIKI